MKIIEVKDSLKTLYDDFVKKNSSYGAILQSHAWGEFQKKFGFPVFRAMAVESEIAGGRAGFFTSEMKALASFLALKKPLPMKKNYLHLVYAPILEKGIRDNEKGKEVMEMIIDYLKKLADKEKTLFIKIEPAEKHGFEDLGFVKSSATHPENSLILKIDKPDDAILTGMKGKTRYNINLAHRKGVKVKRSKNVEDIEDFYRLSELTAGRQKIHLHPENYYKEMLKGLSAENMMDLLIARYRGKNIAAILLSYFGNTATYLHGGADPRHLDTMATSFLQWQGIIYAKDKGCDTYDFFGVSQKDEPNHPWAGISRFKRGFAPNGREIALPGGYDLPLNKFGYKLYKMAKMVKSIF